MWWQPRLHGKRAGEQKNKYQQWYIWKQEPQRCIDESKNDHTKSKVNCCKMVRIHAKYLNVFIFECMWSEIVFGAHWEMISWNEISLLIWLCTSM